MPSGQQGLRGAAGQHHPRACGEQSFLLEITRLQYGSSPRMRGTAASFGPPSGLGRFIPAHAGNRPANWRPQRPERVHPRACGEQAQFALPFSTSGGSSPRMRGTDEKDRIILAKNRFIPAHAGNSGPSSKPRTACSVHPRACGEQMRRTESFSPRIGSSPRMRGTAMCKTMRLLGTRFIPAHAGNRSWRRRSRAPGAVHPRACGEQLSTSSIAI